MIWCKICDLLLPKALQQQRYNTLNAKMLHEREFFFLTNQQSCVFFLALLICFLIFGSGSIQLRVSGYLYSSLISLTFLLHPSLSASFSRVFYWFDPVVSPNTQPGWSALCWLAMQWNVRYLWEDKIRELRAIHLSLFLRSPLFHFLIHLTLHTFFTPHSLH